METPPVGVDVVHLHVVLTPGTEGGVGGGEAHVNIGGIRQAGGGSGRLKRLH